jgi:hypothetical protein
MLAEIRLARELPGLTPRLSSARDAVWRGFAAPERHELINRLMPQKIARRWWTMFNALAIVTDRVFGLFEPMMSYDEHEIVVAKSNIAKMTFQILQNAFATGIYRGPRPGFQVGHL